MNIEVKNYGNVEYQVANGTWYHKDTPREVIDWLETSRASGQRIRIFYGYTAPIEKNQIGLAWTEERDVLGRVGRSCGAVKVPILLASSRSLGGESIMNENIVRIDTKGEDRKIHTVYKHPAFRLPVIAAKEGSDVPMAAGEYTAHVEVDGKTYANTKTMKQAEHLAAFLRGERWAK